MKKEIAIKIRDLTVAYHLKPVLWDIDIDIYKSSLTAILGPNGAGKSTLIKTLLELIPKISGEILFHNKKYNQIRKKISYVPQRNSVDWDFPTTVFDVVLMGRYGHLGWFKRPTINDKKIALESLEKVGMTPYIKRQISELSGGQQQRIFLARALAQEGDIYLMDEPFQGIDIHTEEKIITVLKELQKKKKTIVVVHHDLTTVPKYFDHVILLNIQKIASGETKNTFNKENIQKTFQNYQLKKKEEKN
ncbi:MAG: metal ABC transporter ATP-binding protein [Candidatus Phytoplasma stylosanthis]|uniref:metal ABC transporter ATP-binding protein n=1 Tax=Candidatus Phytoplasma stylosanthis TaxID=2798314 RepID=UPI00293B2CCD|nr:metal ABC transporter ATP-binding protein [Candidatus Phytoplasma stylosanthis]MDV3168097.1 metal ABC transporter ATP-binding protein [Candidatus Phytoplasma stylosanthis]MDV3170704.1 metal ABC transporter ATP-binding protein [Candidatus Phytoplasma stylosanthis]MDV3173905.1 metal ABC transporter ATP-binding protein [Candidatus Phytoplasma stylosanthis]MDV3173961.1 metal ABC transporter ATP-binding protein [Candidatus Phytoplasma stylosanthis]MDV3202665.1 metal ABC transporter ATP-binding p